MKVGFTVMIQKQSNRHHSGRAHSHQEQKGAAGPKFNKEHAHCFFQCEGNFHHEFVSRNNTVNSDFYCDILRRLRENVWQKDQKFGATTTGSFIMTTCRATCPWKPQFVTNNNLVIIPHPPYSLDLVPSDFALFPKLKIKLKGWHFEIVSDIQRESQAVPNSIKENYFHGAFEARKNRCVRSQGDYFEGDGSQNLVS
jgi:histone-lysine N-methyltransferase SETMAR